MILIQSIISHSSVLPSPTPIVGPSPTTKPITVLSQSIFLVIIVSAIVGVVIVVILPILVIVIVVMVIV